MSAPTAPLRRPRPHTKPVKIGGKTRRTIQRCCNGCDRPLGDATPLEVDAAHRGLPLPDVTPECPTCTPNPPDLVWTIELPYTRPPLTLNDRGRSPHARNRIIAKARRNMLVLAVSAKIPPLHRLSIELHYAPYRDRIRDPLNLSATLKPLEDGLVDANVIPDDNPTYVEPTMPVIDPPTTPEGRLYVVIHELAPTAPASTL